MSDHDLLNRIDSKLDRLAEDFAAHLGEHRATAKAGARRWTVASVLAAWCGFALALYAAFK